VVNVSAENTSTFDGDGQRAQLTKRPELSVRAALLSLELLEGDPACLA